MRSFKVHEDATFAPAPSSNKGLKQFGKGNIVSGPENADATLRKNTKERTKPAKFGTKEHGNVVAEAKIDVKRQKKEQEVAEIEHAHRTNIEWQPPSAFDGIDSLAANLKSKFANAPSIASMPVVFPMEIEMENLAELNDSFQVAPGENFEISIEIDANDCE